MKLTTPFKTELYFHFYKEWRSWSVGFCITTQNATFSLGPFWVSIAYFGYDW